MSLSLMPDIVKETTFQNMDITGLLLLVNQSDEFKSDLRRYRMKNCTFSCRMIEQTNDIFVTYRSEVNVHRFSFFKPEHGQYFLENRETVALRKLGNLEMEGTSVFEGSWEFVYSEIFNPMIEVIQHLRDLFPDITIESLEIQFDCIPDIDVLCTALSNLSCTSLCLNMAGENLEEKAKRLLSCLTDLEYLQLRVFHSHFDLDQPLYADKIEISTAKWVNNQKLMTWRFRSAKLSNTCYTNENYVEFINLWMAGEFPNMEKMTMVWNEREVNRETVIRLTGGEEWDERKMEGKPKGTGRFLKHCYHRSDGKIGVIRTFGQYFKFYVWTGKEVEDSD